MVDLPAIELRQPIVSVLGHVDHGKTTLLDKIRGTALASKEVGGITQQIGATEISKEIIIKMCKNIVKKEDVNIPGFLFIDTPGHKSFVNLRKRGGSLADLAILIIDVNSGIQPQTKESIDILKHYKTPFIIVANKIDTISGWRSSPYVPFIKNAKTQLDRPMEMLNSKIYEIIESLSNMGIYADRFDNISDFTKNFAIIPTSAKTGEGIPDLLATLVGMAQRYLKKKIELSTAGGEATILEVNDDSKIGKNIDIILYKGSMNVGDTVIVPAMDKPYRTSVKAIFKLESHGRGHTLKTTKSIIAAMGAKVILHNMDNIAPGESIMVISGDNIDETEIHKFIDKTELKIRTVEEGTIVKADRVGSLEALCYELDSNQINIKIAGIGTINKNDVVTVAGNKEKYNKAIFGFNVSVTSEAKDEAAMYNVNILTGDIIYSVIEQYKEWKSNLLTELSAEVRKQCTNPVIIQLMPDHIFRKSRPAIVGVKIIGGILYSGIRLINDEGVITGSVKSIQNEGKNLENANKKDEVAISIDIAVVGKTIHENQILYSDMSEKDIKRLREANVLTPEEEEIIEKIIVVKRKHDRLFNGIM
ncbi:MAG: translation initiation factor IF-2 [Candidatus Thermoplasmatota archaeon]|nr:translation initiation factor IF-2 [Candidatus Thermoplasmatota archaeon]MCL5964108.1 translation initiation factor IF-2 [Candidatus Thermoplasmatota archaeon]